MKNKSYFKRLRYFFFILFCIPYSCEKNANDNQPEIIGKSVELETYEVIIDKINNNVYECSTFVATSDGGAVLVEYTEDNDLIIARVDASGTIIWDLIYGKPEYMVINAGEVIQASDGSFILTGGVDVSDNNMDAFLIKISDDGNLLWEKTYHISDWETAYSLKQTSDGGYILIGDTSPNFIDDGEDYFVIKTDSDGTLEWYSTYGNTDEWDSGRDIVETDDNEYIMVGVMNWVGQIHRIDHTGDIVWETSLVETFTACDQIIEANDGGYIVLAGYMDPVDYSVVISLIKIDDSGSIIWQKLYGPYQNEIESVLLGNLLNSGYYLIVRQWDPRADAIIYSILTFTNSGDFIE